MEWGIPVVNRSLPLKACHRLCHKCCHVWKFGLSQLDIRSLFCMRAEECYMGWHLLEPGSTGSPVPAQWRELDHSWGR